MENSDNNIFDNIIEETNVSLDEMEFIQAVREPSPLEVTGVEEMSLGESFGLFFKEFSTSIDRKLASMGGSVHTVDGNKLRRAVESRKIMYVKNTGKDITVPGAYVPGIANMMMHTKGTVEGVFLISSLKTEAVRLYDWLKHMIKVGRADTNFKWSISNFDVAIDQADHFIRNLPDTTRRTRCPLGDVYVNFEEMYDVIDTYNSVVKNLNARDAEIAAKELRNTYELGNLLIAKIQSNELTFDKRTITELQFVFNKFVELTNLCGAMMTLLNELSAVLRAQIEEVSTM